MAPKKLRAFDAKAFLESTGLGKRVVAYARREVVFSQGDPSDSVMYLQSGGVQLSVLSHSGKNGSRARSCCSRAMARETNRSGSCRKSRRKHSPKWSGRRGPA